MTWRTRTHGTKKQVGTKFQLKPRGKIQRTGQKRLVSITPKQIPITIIRERGNENRVEKDKETISNTLKRLPQNDKEKIANIILDYDWMNSGQVVHESMFNQHWQILGDEKAKSMVVKGKDNIVFNPSWVKEGKDFREVVAHEVGHSVFNNLPKKDRGKWVEKFHDSVKRFGSDFQKRYGARLYEYGTLDMVFDTRINWDLAKYGAVSPYSMNSAQEYFSEHYKARYLYPKDYVGNLGEFT